MKLTIIKPLHTGWLIEFYNRMSTLEGQEVMRNGWLRAGIADAIKLGSDKLPSLDPFKEIDNLVGIDSLSVELEDINLVNLRHFVTQFRQFTTRFPRTQTNKNVNKQTCKQTNM